MEIFGLAGPIFCLRQPSGGRRFVGPLGCASRRRPRLAFGRAPPSAGAGLSPLWGGVIDNIIHFLFMELHRDQVTVHPYHTERSCASDNREGQGGVG